jgi:8-oxo-dGTP diphosphatase
MTKTNLLSPKVAVDTVVLSILDDRLKVLLLQIKEGMYAKKWAVPGGLVQSGETLDLAAERVMEQKTNLKIKHLEQLYTFGELNRDLRSRAISVAYFLLLNMAEKLEIRKPDYYQDMAWFDVNKLPKMAFDHEKIIKTATARLQDKIAYSNVAYALLPTEFTLTELQHIYEIIWGRPLDKRNFRKKCCSWAW